jgi:hypothetical protein
MTYTPFSAGTLQKVADTGISGFALQNGTPTILSFTVPNDGNPHTITFSAVKHVTVAETGGQIHFTFLTPDGASGTGTPFNGGAGVGVQIPGIASVVVQPGSTVSFVQSSALTAGASVVWIQAWMN